MKFSKFYSLLFIAVFVSLTGCQTIPSNDHSNLALNQLQHWRMKARIAVNTEQDNLSATLDWKNAAKNFDFHVYGLLGVTYARLIQTDGMASIQLQKQQTVTAPDAQQLLSYQLGWDFPIDALAYWVKGIAFGDPREKISREQNGAISAIVLNEWQVEFSQYRNYAGQQMPRIIKASHPRHGRLKIVVKSWTFYDKDFRIDT